LSENVKIPLSLLNQTIDLLECIDVSSYDFPIPLEYDAVLSAFRHKRQRLDLRQSYANIIFTKDEDARFNARMKYLRDKQNIPDA